MPEVDPGIVTGAAAVAVVQVLTLALYLRRWLAGRRTVFWVAGHYGLTFGLLFWMMRVADRAGAGPLVIVAGYSCGLVAALALMLTLVQRRRAQQERSEE